MPVGATGTFGETFTNHPNRSPSMPSQPATLDKFAEALKALAPEDAEAVFERLAATPRPSPTRNRHCGRHGHRREDGSACRQADPFTGGTARRHRHSAGGVRERLRPAPGRRDP